MGNHDTSEYENKMLTKRALATASSIRTIWHKDNPSFVMHSV